METKVTWKDGMSFTGTADSGYTVPLGADLVVGGASDGFRPMELMGISLAGCTAMDVISILRKKQQAVTNFEVKVHADRSEEHPKVFTLLVITYVVTGRSVDEAALLRAIELSATKYCPAQAMLGKVALMDLFYEIHDENGALVKNGRYTPQPSQADS
jgi:putative redox protein